MPNWKAAPLLGCLSVLAGCAGLPERPVIDPAGSGEARNLILFIGDGMGVSTVTAARILEGQLRGEYGEENLLSFEHFPHTALAKTYNSNQQTPDSAGTMSAMMTGVKTRAGVINVLPENLRGDCSGSLDRGLTSLPELARAAGLATGIVTTTRVTHATPAATYGRGPHRLWEVDSMMTQPAREAGCVDFARQLLEPPDGRGHDVILGGGRTTFLPQGHPDPEYPDRSDARGARADGRDLIATWQQAGGVFVWNQAQFDAAPVHATTRLLGLFEPSHMRYELDRASDTAGEPSLAEMTARAIDLLALRPNGYVLVVEAGRIDHGHHANNAARALHDTIALSDAVAVAVDRVGDDTLIVVTADHSHVFTIGGYPTRGNPILGLVRVNDGGGEPSGRPARDGLGRTYPTLGYANGPGYLGASEQQVEGYKRYLHEPMNFQHRSRPRPDLDDEQAMAVDFLQPALIPLASESHGGEDVPVYALGPGADQVRGVVEQNLIFRWLVQAQPLLRAELCRQQACPEAPRASWQAPIHPRGDR